ncbi:MAG: hypothetical protein JNK09_05545 [Prolixibacteraceae bacterium]|nr:hypothetical protein [Prolixibacteraceae bacterium]
MRLRLTLLASVIFFVSHAQQPNLHTPVDMVDNVSNIENLIRALSFPSNMETTEAAIEGNAYLNDEFSEGTVALLNGTDYKNIPLRYNIYNNQIEFRNKAGKIYNINNQAELRQVTIGSSKFEFIQNVRGKSKSQFFAEVLTEGNVVLLKHHRIKIQPAKPAQTHQEAKAPTFVKMPSEYMIRRSNGDIRQFKNQKELLSLLADKNEPVEELIRRKNLSVAKESDLIKIVRFYNEH